jgi:predicted transcriptional regulator
MAIINENNLHPRYLSIYKHTIAQQIYVELEEDYQFPKAICRGLTELFTDYLDIYFGGQRNPYQIVFNCISYTVPPGVSSKEAKTIPVKLTVFDPDDLLIASEKGVQGMIKHRIIRIVEEAYDQEGTLTQADVAMILGVSLRTVTRYIREIQEHEDIFLHTRGNVKDIGPGVSHKTRIIELYLQNNEYGDIERKTRHSSAAIMRYVKEFSRVFILKEQGHSFHEIRLLTDLSEKLLGEYMDLIDRYNGEEYQERLDMIRSVAFKKTSWFEFKSSQMVGDVL